MTNDKILLFTHGIDIDGYGCAVLAKLAFGENAEIEYADNFELDEMFAQRIYGVSAKEILDGTVDKQTLFEKAKENLKDVQRIYITDHCLSLPLCQFVNEDKATVSKLLVLDHHASRKDAQGQFPWVIIKDEIEYGIKACGTRLFYFYLMEQRKIPPSYPIGRWAMLTTLCDTWTWKGTSFEEDCVKLDTLGKALGREEYVEHFVRKLHRNMAKKGVFEFSVQEEKLIRGYLAAYAKQLDLYVEKIRVIDFDGFKAGVVHIKDLFKNDIAEKVRNLPLGKEIDFLLMPVDDRESVSLRNINPNCDVSKIAQAHGGGGHFAAASFPKSKLQEMNFEK